VGPFAVTRVVNPNAIELALPPQMQALHPVFNISRLKPYVPNRPEFATRPQRYDRPPPDVDADSNGDRLFEVERLMACRQQGRSRYYLVAWKGYPPEENTWEARASLLRTAREAVAEFEATHVHASAPATAAELSALEQGRSQVQIRDNTLSGPLPRQLARRGVPFFTVPSALIHGGSVVPPSASSGGRSEPELAQPTVGTAAQRGIDTPRCSSSAPRSRSVGVPSAAVGSSTVASCAGSTCSGSPVGGGGASAQRQSHRGGAKEAVGPLPDEKNAKNCSELTSRRVPSRTQHAFGRSGPPNCLIPAAHQLAVPLGGAPAGHAGSAPRSWKEVVSAAACRGEAPQRAPAPESSGTTVRQQAA
jgi:hypothetical protein